MLPTDMQRFTTLLIAISAALLCGEIAAHDLPAERKLVVDVGSSSVEMMLVYQQPKSDAAMLLFKKYDINGDGDLTGKEARLAGREWMPRMLHGLEFEVADERPRAGEPEIKFQREDDGGLSAAAYFSWSLDDLPKGDTRVFHVRIKREDDAPETLVDLRAGDSLVVESFEASSDRKTSSSEVLLHIGERATLEVRRPTPDSDSKK